MQGVEEAACARTGNLAPPEKRDSQRHPDARYDASRMVLNSYERTARGWGWWRRESLKTLAPNSKVIAIALFIVDIIETVFFEVVVVVHTHVVAERIVADLHVRERRCHLQCVEGGGRGPPHVVVVGQVQHEACEARGLAEP